jgi:hypothetical protein
MDPTANDPFRFSAVADSLQQQAQPQPQPQPAELTIEAAPLAPAVLEAAPLNGEVLPPEAPAPETPPSVPQYPIGLIDFNQAIVVIDNSDFNDEEFDNASVVTVLKGSLHPVVVSFWKHGEQCVAQFDTDGDSSCGDYKVEQDQPYPRTVYVVIGRDGRNLELDEELYASEEAARSETSIDEVVGVFPLLIQAPATAIAAPQVEAISDFHDGGVETEENDEEIDGTEGSASNVTDINQPPTEMYVAGRTRHVGETVTFYRKNCGTRTGTIRKMRRDSRQSLFVEPTDGSGAYWALNKNVRY